VAVEEKLPSPSYVNLRITKGKEIQKLNAKYLGRDAKTDVISFAADLPDKSFLGDIVIDSEVASEQAGANGLNNEILVLFLHGLLHLIGYDHLSIKDETFMKQKEKDYFQIFKKRKAL
jgi:probable rRNA maturation factor